jgi:hypothetical protein
VALEEFLEGNYRSWIILIFNLTEPFCSDARQCNACFAKRYRAVIKRAKMENREQEQKSEEDDEEEQNSYQQTIPEEVYDFEV